MRKIPEKKNSYAEHDPMNQLLIIMAHLRDHKKGCPWDLKQNFHTIAPYTIEEAYEVADAIEHGSMKDLCEELGDLLFQVVFHAQIATEQKIFNFDDVVKSISDKMVKRHPHIFNRDDIEDATDPTLGWEEQKAIEREEKAKLHGLQPSTLDGVPTALPALTRALKLQKRAAGIGFDWHSIMPVLDKVQEELEELKIEIATGHKKGMIEEIGDLLFSVVNLSRHLNIDPEFALRSGNNKFERRFKLLEFDLVAQGRNMRHMSIKGLESIWRKIKKQEIK